MDVLLQQALPPQPNSRMWLRSGQWITIGASQRADFCIHGESELPALCAKLEVRDSDCLITDISPTRPVLVVNGAPTAMAVLQSGDTIGIGRTELQVQWKITEAPAEAPAPIHKYREEQTSAGVHKWSPTSDSTWPMADVLNQLCQSRAPWLLVNGRAGGSQVPRWLLEQDDYYAQAPDEVRREHSLQILRDLPLSDLWKVYAPLHAANAAIWAFPDGPTAQVLTDAKLYLAWFARPSILEMNLQHGSQMFVQNLFKPFAGFCFRPPSGQDWVLYSKSGITPGSLGFQEPARVAI